MKLEKKEQKQDDRTGFRVFNFSGFTLGKGRSDGVMEYNVQKTFLNSTAEL